MSRGPSRIAGFVDRDGLCRDLNCSRASLRDLIKRFPSIDGKWHDVGGKDQLTIPDAQEWYALIAKHSPRRKQRRGAAGHARWMEIVEERRASKAAGDGELREARAS